MGLTPTTTGGLKGREKFPESDTILITTNGSQNGTFPLTELHSPDFSMKTREPWLGAAMQERLVNDRVDFNAHHVWD